MKPWIEKLIADVKNWFAENDLNNAVVGFSGGIDSATTAALISYAGISVTLVDAYFMGQHKSSIYDAKDFSKLYNKMGFDYTPFELPPYLMNSGKEAALPIIRNAIFYGVAAELKSFGGRACVVGTINFDEGAYLGFWGKASDAAQDFYPISHLHKSEVYELAKELNVPQEIINAIPSGDLQWSGDLNDYKMIGATYAQIESFAKFVDSPKVKSIDQILEFIKTNIDDPKTFTNNILKNRFKYKLPLPNFHINNRLELFRYRAYPAISMAAEMYQDLHKSL